MSTFNGLPAHILLNHFVVVLAPLAAILAILCALWPAARRRLIWLVLLLAVGTLALTPLTTGSGGWLADRIGPSPALTTHEQLGETLIYLMAALLASVMLLTGVHIRLARGRSVKFALHAVVGLLVIAAAVGTLVQTYRIGDSGARAAWGNLTSSAPNLLGGQPFWSTRAGEPLGHGAAVQRAFRGVRQRASLLDGGGHLERRQPLTAEHRELVRGRRG
jgi:hypothetical protein